MHLPPVLVKFTPEATPEQKLMWREEIIALGAKIEQVTETRAGEKISIARSAALDGGFEDGKYFHFHNKFGD